MTRPWRRLLGYFILYYVLPSMIGVGLIVLIAGFLGATLT